MSCSMSNMTTTRSQTALTSRPSVVRPPDYIGENNLHFQDDRAYHEYKKIQEVILYVYFKLKLIYKETI